MARKIVFLIDSFIGPYAGTERQLWNLLKGLDRRRFDPELVMLRHSDYSRSQHDWPCPVQILGIKKLASIGGIVNMLKFVHYLRNTDAKILQVFFADASILGPVIAKLAGMKFVAARRDMGIWYTPSILRILRIFNKFVDKVIVNSLAVKELVVRKELISDGRVEVIYNGLEPTSRSVEKTPAVAVRSNPVGYKGHPVIGIVANLRPVKRIDDLLIAFQKVRERIPSACLIVVGEGELETQLKVQASDLGIMDVVEFTGRLEDPESVVQHFDIAVLCSESEGLSNAVMEYLRAGKPVVCTNIGGNPELVRDGENGFLVPVGDVEKLAESIIKIASNGQLYESMSACAKKAIKQFSIERMLARHMQLYTNLIGTVH